MGKSGRGEPAPAPKRSTRSRGRNVQTQGSVVNARASPTAAEASEAPDRASRKRPLELVCSCRSAGTSFTPPYLSVLHTN